MKAKARLPRAKVVGGSRKRQRAPARKPEPRFVSPGELTDLALLPGEFRHFKGQVLDELRILSDKILPMITRHDKIIDDHHIRIAEGERAQFATNDRLDAVEAEIARLKAPSELK